MKLTAHNLTVNIGAKTLCRDLTFELQHGESLAILGRNGAGKSTLLLTLAGLRPTTHGEVLLDGVALPNLAPIELARLRAYCPQQQHDAFSATVLETALVGRHPHLGRWDWESSADEALALQALAKVGLRGMEARTVDTLSGGERQRLALAATIVQAPQLYLLDEPLTHLDLNHAIAMLELFTQQTRQGSSMIAVLHDPNLARRYCQRALLLFDDGSWLQGHVDQVLTLDNLSRLYAHPLQTLTTDGQPWFIPQPKKLGDHHHE